MGFLCTSYFLCTSLFCLHSIEKNLVRILTYNYFSSQLFIILQFVYPYVLQLDEIKIIIIISIHTQIIHHVYKAVQCVHSSRGWGLVRHNSFWSEAFQFPTFQLSIHAQIMRTLYQTVHSARQLKLGRRNSFWSEASQASTLQVCIQFNQKLTKIPSLKYHYQSNIDPNFINIRNCYFI